MTFADKLAHHLRQRERLRLHEKEAIACAVLIPLVPVAAGEGLSAEDEFEVVYTLRSEHLPNHKGQVAFPGGKRSGAEELLDTALRESSEEVGIEPADVAIIGCLDDVSTMAGQYVITPWVGVLPAGYGFRANPHEVADIFAVRLSDLGDPRHHARATRRWGGNEFDLPVITAGRHEIWGATLQITGNLLKLIGEALKRSAR